MDCISFHRQTWSEIFTFRFFFSFFLYHNARHSPITNHGFVVHIYPQPVFWQSIFAAVPGAEQLNFIASHPNDNRLLRESNHHPEVDRLLVDAGLNPAAMHVWTGTGSEASFTAIQYLLRPSATQLRQHQPRRKVGRMSSGLVGPQVWTVSRSLY